MFIVQQHVSATWSIYFTPLRGRHGDITNRPVAIRAHSHRGMVAHCEARKRHECDGWLVLLLPPLFAVLADVACPLKLEDILARHQSSLLSLTCCWRDSAIVSSCIDASTWAR